MIEALHTVYHNSLLKKYRSPFGALPAGTEVTLRIDAPQDVSVRLRLWIYGSETVLEGKREAGCVVFTFTAPRTPCLLWYYFILRTGNGEYRYGGRSGEGFFFPDEPPSYQITVYDGAYATPEWFRQGIVYQIFPDRFSRGDAGSLSRAQHHTSMGRRLHLHEDWGGDVLYEPFAYERYYEPCDFFGGDLNGIRERLPYLKTLGVSCIYLNPVFESPSNHRYNTADYHKIDPILGDEAALSNLTQAAAELGMRVMFDGVFSHTGDDSVYFDRYLRYGEDGAYHNPASPYREWYAFSKYPDEYRCWWGFKSLPELNELTPSYMEFVAGVLAHWAQFGVTSWRLDVADELPDPFIVFLREKLKALDPDGVLLGEVWEDASNKEVWGARRKYVDGYELDGVMGYPFMRAVCDFLTFGAPAESFIARMNALRENYPKPFFDAQLNLLGSHDTVRILSMLSGAPDRDALTREQQAAYAPTDEALAQGKARLRQAVALQMALPGVPSIYYGDEAGLTGMADPFNRKPYPWGREDAEILAFYRAYAALRASSGALREGLCGLLALAADVLAVLRCAGGAARGESVLCLVNRGDRPFELVLRAADFLCGPDAGALYLHSRYQDVLNGEAFTFEEGEVRLTLQAGACLLLRSQ